MFILKAASGLAVFTVLLSAAKYLKKVKKLHSLINSGPVPLYHQVRKIIRDKILSGEWAYGEELPSELRLCEEFNLCRGTIQQAMEGLVAEGLIVRQKGKGTFVTYRKVKLDLFLEPGFPNAGKNRENSYTELLSAKKETAKSFILSKLKISDLQEVCVFERKHFIKNKPVMLDYSYIIAEFGEELFEKDLENVAMYKYLESAASDILNVYRLDICAIPLDKYEQYQLDFPPGNVGLQLQCLASFGDRPVMFNRRIYRGDSCNLFFELTTFDAHQKLEASVVEVEIADHT